MADPTVATGADEPLSRPAHTLPYSQVVHELEVDVTQGLTADEAARRLAQYGPNGLGKQQSVRPWQILIAQVVNAMTLVLVLALAASFAIQAWIEGGVLAFMILLNLIIGFIQDLQAARTIASLESLNSPTARVLRAGATATATATATASSSSVVVIPAADLVPGDIIDLKTGDVVPADARVLHAVNLEADEALLTGESVPVRKDPAAVFDDELMNPGDRINMAFSSSTVTKGRGRAVVVATGLRTEVGAIAAALQGDGDVGKGKLKKGPDGKAAASKDYALFALGATWDWLGKFLGVTVGTPLQRKLAQLFLYIFFFAIVCCIIVLGANEFRTRTDVIIYAVATAIGTLPVTLILVLTITMAAGAKVMVERNVLVRNMRSLEALGGVTNICSDKTGTLTQGKMVAKMAWLPGHGTYSVDTGNEPYNPEVGTTNFTPIEPKDISSKAESSEIPVIPATEAATHACLGDYLDVAALANLATVRKTTGGDGQGEQDTGKWEANGDPTEIAIQVLATRFGRSGLPATAPSSSSPSSSSSSSTSEWTQLAEFPFDSSVKKMSTLCRNTTTGQVHIFTKGAVERVLESCVHIAVAGAPSSSSSPSSPLTEAAKSDILANMEALARRGLRVLALASTVIPEEEARQGKLARTSFERDLVFRGLIGIYDPPRPESRPSVFKCHRAGIAVHMLTGDHPETARSIATQVGILPARIDLLRADVAASLVMSAHDFDRLSDDELDRLPQLPLVVARCAPSTKVRMIDALHRRRCYVAMTGDGVNDSPSLKRADVGIAMGLNGSDVAKSASDIVLSDDNFASILNAVEEGRRIFDNIQKFMLHVLAGNVGFVSTLLVGLAYKDSSGVSVFQVTPVEILYLLLVAAAFTETGLGFEAASPDILNRPPQSLKYGVFTPEFLADLVGYGILMAVCLLSSFIIVLFGMYDGNLGHDCNLRYSPSCEGVFRARSTCFVAMMWVFLLFAWELVDGRLSFFAGLVRNPRAWAARLWRNPFLFWSVVVGSVSVVPTLYIPVINDKVFLHAGIGAEWGIVFVSVFFFCAGAEAWKWAKRVYLRRHNMMERKKAGASEEDLEARVFEKYYLQSEGSESEK
ncbi:potassium/sodium eff [Sodiomyces alkalinus F11]|uniref:P-type Na(+) transporter n=1 Tax=Sodiomyces alkalinus (strain CBS 110278 / VKM F-3762 / F11) TaxID=1314773 RepID=A0A3N2Q147_SODAK|nr:potassium/sodium eff [Sodiomyces alkalinus F11]ROT40436.1 potassium/sodium eff [Sodiomyces alkalinus F11]